MNKEPSRPRARLPRGFRDRGADEAAAERRMLDTIRGLFESYGFEAIETPALEYTDALGKFLPDQDRPNEGVFSLQDEDDQWLSLRYDLTAPLARYVAENFQNLPKPFRRYQVGLVWRNEKPGPGRFREFMQFDADTVGSASPAADAELLMMLADTYEALGLKRGEYVVKLSNRKVLDGVMETAEVGLAKRGTVLRAIDKLDRLGLDGVIALLGPGRKDPSGDFTPGAGLSDQAITRIVNFTGWRERGSGAASIAASNEAAIANFEDAVRGSAVGEAGVAELSAIRRICEAAGYGKERILIDPSIVRGLDYYTGPVFEAQLAYPVRNDAGEPVVFGSIGSGGRYDDLVARFTGQQAPATGVSIGVSRLLAALKARSGAELFTVEPLIVVLVLDRENVARSFQLAGELRAAGLRAETYTGESGMKAQLKYADRRGAAIAVIEGADERARGDVTLKDLALGAELAKSVGGRAEWVGTRPAQMSVPRAKLAETARAMLAARGK